MKRLVRGFILVVALVYGVTLFWPSLLEQAPERLQPVLLVLVATGALVDVVFLSSARAWAWWREDSDQKDD